MSIAVNASTASEPIIPFYEIDKYTQCLQVLLGAKVQARRILSRVGSYGIDVSALDKQPESQTLKDLEQALYAATLPLHGLNQDAQQCAQET